MRVLFTLGLLLGALAGCAALPPAPPVLDDAAFAPPLAMPGRDALLGASPAMRDFLANEALPLLRARGPQLGLVEALGRDGRLRLDYDARTTRSAAQAFDERAGHCLSLVLMTAALARELGLPVRYQQVPGSLAWERRDGLELAMGHVNIAIGPPERPGTWYVIDFQPDPETDRSQRAILDEARIVAMVHNNRAAEALGAGRLREAWWSARAAVQTDPRHADAWNTLAVVLQRQGDAAQAERVLRHALAVDAGHAAAMANLAGLLTARGQLEEAAVWRERQARLGPERPFALVDAARALLDAGDARGALARLQQAQRSGGAWHELHHAMARAYIQLGDRERAEQHLAAAQRLGTGADQRARYAAKLDRLRELAAQ